MEAIKDGAGSADHRFCGPRLFQSKNRGPQTRRSALLARFFDRALGTVQEYNEKVQYIHLSPVRARLARCPEDWPWSSVHDNLGSLNCAPTTPSGLSVDRVLPPADAHTRI